MNTARWVALAVTLIGCGANVNVNQGGGASGGAGAGGWQPCAGKACGDDCTPCDPSDPSCELPGTSLYCDAQGACVFEAPTCPVGSCARDSDCAVGAEWCENGACVPCDNGGELCDIACPYDWGLYERNGCTPCECAPRNECASDAECGGGTCYAGAYCFPGCLPAGDPACCQGNLCDQAGCPAPPPTGCVRRGCPVGDSCEMIDCAPSGCGCDGASWGCDADCSGGVCVTPL